METVLRGRAMDSPDEFNLNVLMCDAEEAEVVSSRFVADLRQLLHDPIFSDVVFVCSDGKRVQALRKFLACRSEVLKSMLLNGMAESSLDEIEIPSFSSSALLSVFEFLYTDNLVDHIPQNLKIACEVVVASRFFLLPKLEMITHKFIFTQTSEAATNSQKAASLLTEAMDCQALCDEADVNLRVLVEVLSSNWSESVYVQSLSRDAFDYLLANSKGDSEDDGTNFSFREYLRFRQVIRWWLYQSDLGSDAAEELLNNIAPDEKKALYFCKTANRVKRRPQDSCMLEEASHFSDDWSSFQLNETSRISAMILASNVDCRRILPLLLAKVVVPSSIVSAAEIQDSFRFHALRRSVTVEISECVWEHGESYSTCDQGFVIHRTGNTIGSAVLTEAMSRSTVDYQWQFVLEESCAIVELGFIGYSTMPGAEKPNFQGTRLSDQCRARVLRFEGGKASINWKGPRGGHLAWKELDIDVTVMPTTVTFNYDTSDDVCGLWINNNNYDVVWKRLPKRVYHPAVSFGDSPQGRVRIELLNGFDII